ncbi:flagellar assembly protein A [Clostridium algidicarnis]|uniref:flagellar assembly protein A n=1 Tax=Clostridium algidicarnis TaxID=37659 RepID=UPI003FD7A5CA
MNEKIYSASTIEKCILKATKDLGIAKEDLIYKIIEEKKGTFIKKAVINVILQKEDEESNAIKQKQGTISINDGKIYVSDPEDGGLPAKINPSKNLIIKVNGEEIQEEVEVFSSTNIETSFPEDDTIPKRTLDINVFPDKMKVYISTEFTPKKIFKIKDCKDVQNLHIEIEEKQLYSPLYNEEEIIEALTKVGVVFGIIDEQIKKLTKIKNQNHILVAEGLLPIDKEEDYISFKFGKDTNKFKEDKSGTIDYKSIGSVEAIKKGDIIAEKKAGKEGRVGKNVRGVDLPYKPAKAIIFKAVEGCYVSEEGDKIISSIDGKPSFRNGGFFVKPIHEVPSDVNLKTGNIKFSGEIVVKGNVTEGMKVEGGSTVVIQGAVESSEVVSKGDININGNIILSKIYGGGKDVLKIEYIQNLTVLLTTFEAMIKNILEIKKFNLVGRDTGDGELIKALIDSKFKNIPRLCMNVIKDARLDEDYDTELIDILKKSIMGFGPLNIKHFSEIDDIISMIKDKIEILNNNLNLPSNISINYCQDSDVSSSGDIIFKGKGEYISNISSNNNIYFEQPGAIARGGKIKAKNEIRARVVGSPGSVFTTLSVEANGHIYVDVAYENTIFAFGEKESILEIASKDVHAYMNSEGEIIIDRLKL